MSKVEWDDIQGKFRAYILPRNEWWDLTGFVYDTNKKRVRLFRMNPDMPAGMGSEVFDSDEVELFQENPKL